MIQQQAGRFPPPGRAPYPPPAGVFPPVHRFGPPVPEVRILPLIGFVTAVTTTILVLVRRRAAPDRMFAAWTGAPPARPW